MFTTQDAMDKLAEVRKYLLARTSPVGKCMSGNRIGRAEDACDALQGVLDEVRDKEALEFGQSVASGAAAHDADPPSPQAAEDAAFLDALDERLKRIERRRRDPEDDLGEMAAQRDSARNMVAVKETVIERLYEEKGELHRQLDDAHEATRASIESLVTERDDLAEKLNEGRQRIQALEAEVRTLHTEVGADQADEGGLLDPGLRLQLTQMEDAAQGWKDLYENRQARVRTLEGDNAMLRRELERAYAQRDRARGVDASSDEAGRQYTRRGNALAKEVYEHIEWEGLGEMSKEDRLAHLTIVFAIGIEEVGDDEKDQLHKQLRDAHEAAGASPGEGLADAVRRQRETLALREKTIQTTREVSGCPDGERLPVHVAGIVQLVQDLTKQPSQHREDAPTAPRQDWEKVEPKDDGSAREGPEVGE